MAKTVAELESTIQSMQDQFNDLAARITSLEAAQVETNEKIKIKKIVKQVVFDKEGDQTKVRARIVTVTPTGQVEDWEDVTEKFNAGKIDEVITTSKKEVKQ